MTRFFWFLLVLTGVLVAALPLTAVAGEPAGPAASERPDDPGVIVYRANYCGVCHELAVAGTRGTFGPNHAGMGKIAAERIADPGYGGDATTAAEYIAESILVPSAYFVPGYAATAHPMPSFAHLSEADVAALVDLLLAQ